jgi:hypothetical protein
MKDYGKETDAEVIARAARNPLLQRRDPAVPRFSTRSISLL